MLMNPASRKYRSILFSLLVSAAGLILAPKSGAQVTLDESKLSSAAKNLISSISAAEKRQYWLYLDSSAVDPSALHLSERARARRAKVDPDNLLIDWRDYPIADSVIDAIRAAGLTVKSSSRWLKAVVVEADLSGLSKASAMPFVRTIDPSKTLVMYRDPELRVTKPRPQQLQTVDFEYGLADFQNRFINAVKLHKAGYTGQGILMAFFDSGFDHNHPAFDSANIIATYDFINGDITVDDSECPTQGTREQTYHGTATLSIVAANVPDTMVGVAPNADFALAKTEITCDGIEIKIEEYNWIAAAEWADTIGADIINSSLGYAVFTDSGSYTFDDLDGNTTLITIAADLAASKNIFVANSAGNERDDPWGHIIAPSDGDSVLAAGAVAADSSLAYFSSPGPSADGRIKPDVVTLGVSVALASHLGGYTYSSGTSYSSPLIAGGAALALERNPTLTAADLMTRIRQTASRADNPDNNFGYGLFDAVRAANLIIEYDLPPIIQIRYDEPQVIDFSVINWDAAPPALSAYGFPEWILLGDNGDGTGFLDITPDPSGPARLQFGLIATTDSFVDTTIFELQIYGRLENPVTAGPNPFSDTLYIYVDPSAGNVQSISLFNVAGEIVWEKVNNFPITADVLTVLQNQWDGRNLDGKIVAAGVYVLVVSTDRQTYRLKLLKTK